MQRVYLGASLLAACAAAADVQVSAIWAVSNTTNTVRFNASAFEQLSPTIYSAAGLQDGGSNILNLNWLSNNNNPNNNNPSNTPSPPPSPAPMSQADVTALVVGILCFCVALLLAYCWCCGWCAWKRHKHVPKVEFPELRTIRATITVPGRTYALVRGCERV